MWSGAIVALAVSGLLAACGGEDPTATPTSVPAPAPTATPTAAPAPTPTPLPPGATAPPAPTAVPPTPTPDMSFETRWNELIAAAQEEGEIVLALGSTGSRWGFDIYDYFAEKFDIEIIASTGSGTANRERILAERANGRYTVDVSDTGSNSMDVLVTANAAQPIWPLLIRPDVIENTGQYYRDMPIYTDRFTQFAVAESFGVDLNPVDVHWNTDNVSQEEIDSVQSYYDFLDPKWRGRIVVSMDPSFGGGTDDRTQAWIYIGMDFLDRLIREQDVAFLPGGSGGLLADGIARGKYDLMLFGAGGARGQLRSMAQAGLPVAELDRSLAEGPVAQISGTILGMDQPPHPAAQQLFLNWWMSQEGMTTYVERWSDPGGPSPRIRKDIPQGGVPDTIWSLVQDVKQESVVTPEESVAAQDAQHEFLEQIFTELRIYGY